MTRLPPPDRPGPQAERTELGWERTGLGLLAAAALLLVRPVEPVIGRIAVAGADIAMALFMVWLGRARGRPIGVLRDGPAGRFMAPDAHLGVLLVGWGVAVIAFATALLIV